MKATMLALVALTLVACGPSNNNPDSPESDTVAVDSTSTPDVVDNDESVYGEVPLTDTTTPETAEVTDEVTPGADSVDAAPEASEPDTFATPDVAEPETDEVEGEVTPGADSVDAAPEASEPDTFATPDVAEPETDEVEGEVTPGADSVDAAPSEVAETETNDPETTPEAVEAEDEVVEPEVVVVPPDPVRWCEPFADDCDDGNGHSADFCVEDADALGGGSHCQSKNLLLYYFKMEDKDGDSWFPIPEGLDFNKTCEDSKDCKSSVVDILEGFIPGSLIDCVDGPDPDDPQSGDPEGVIFPGAPEPWNDCLQIEPALYFF